jgi:N utilization substance protein B
MAQRSRARDVALQVLFQDDLNPKCNPAIGDDLINEQLDSPKLVEFARELVAGVRRNRTQIDQAIEEVAQNWSLDRMAPTDRNAIRLGAFEILHSDTPDRVAINEAIELAKRFGSAKSGKFINGILDQVMNKRSE